MGVLEELTLITNTKVPAQPGDEFWEQLVKTGAALSDADWTRLSKPAKKWMNDGVFALKDLEGYSIEPLKPESAPKPDPVVEEDHAAAEKPTEIELEPPPPPPAKRGRPPVAPGEPSKRRAMSFKRGRCYYFAAYLVQRDGGLDGMRAPELAAEYNESQPNENLRVSDRTASVLMYDILATLRVLRDLGQFDHPIVADIPRHEFTQDQAS